MPATNQGGNQWPVARIIAAYALAAVFMIGGGATRSAGAAEIKVIGSPGVREIYTRLVPGVREGDRLQGRHHLGRRDQRHHARERGRDRRPRAVAGRQHRPAFPEGKLVGGRVDVAKSGVGIAIRAGAPKIDVGSAEGLRKALLAAKSIAYSAGPSGLYIAALIEKWGIADQLKPKIVPVPTNTPIGEVVARGDAEIGFQQVSELLPVVRHRLSRAAAGRHPGDHRVFGGAP